MKRKIVALFLAIAFVLTWRCIWIYMPSEAERIFYVQETGETIRETLSYEEAVAVKKVLWGKIQWPEWLYGYPACGFGKIYAIVLDGSIYMPAWDSCGMLAVKELASQNGTYYYINLTQRQISTLEEIITSHDTQ